VAEARSPLALFSNGIAQLGSSQRVAILGMLLAVLACGFGFHQAAWGGFSGGLGVPLDDVFIHFNYARALAEGHPFEWISGQGYSSGESSPLYPFLLAPGYLLGFHSATLSFYAVGVGATAVLYGSLRLAGIEPSKIKTSATSRSTRIALGTFALMLCLSNGITACAWFSGMEIAAFSGALFTFIAEAQPLRTATAYDRKRMQRRLGLLGLVLTMLRPEAIFVVGPFATLAGFWSRRQNGFVSTLRVALPSAVFVLLLASMHRAYTGEWQAAGAILKLLGEQPYAHPFDRSRDFVLNLAAAKWALYDQELGAGTLVRWGFVLAAIAPLRFRRTRALACALTVSALFFALAVSANHTARFQYFRYYVPCICLLAVSTALGLSELIRRRNTLVAWAWLSVLLIPGLTRLPEHIRFFGQAARNIRDQQVAMGREVARQTDPSAIILVGDAGAIPYISRRHAIDALGLGGFHGLPFARAATFGEGAMLELIERLPAAMRPTHLALFPEWFPKTTELFGTEIYRVSLANNVISGGVNKVLYQANFDAMQTKSEFPKELAAEVLDELDVGDIVSEREHQYRSPAPEGGWVQALIRSENGRRIFDAGRVIPPVQEEQMHLRANHQATRIIIRVGAADSEVELVAGSKLQPCAPVETTASKWFYVECPIESARAATTHVLRAGTRGYTHFHSWFVR
jgi:hypothetical protein